jgi:hypothetical protein
MRPKGAPFTLEGKSKLDGEPGARPVGGSAADSLAKRVVLGLTWLMFAGSWLARCADLVSPGVRCADLRTNVAMAADTAGTACGWR